MYVTVADEAPTALDAHVTWADNYVIMCKFQSDGRNSIVVVSSYVFYSGTEVSNMSEFSIFYSEKVLGSFIV